MNHRERERERERYDIGRTSPSTDPITLGAWQVHLSNSTGESGSDPVSCCHRGHNTKVVYREEEGAGRG